MNDHPFLACDLFVLDQNQREAHKQIAAVFLKSIEAVREFPDGYALRLPTETGVIQQAAAFLSRERLCCPFFHFQLEVTPERGPVWLHVSGREGVKQYIEESLLERLDVPVE